MHKSRSLCTASAGQNMTLNYKKHAVQLSRTARWNADGCFKWKHRGISMSKEMRARGAHSTISRLGFYPRAALSGCKGAASSTPGSVSTEPTVPEPAPCADRLSWALSLQPSGSRMSCWLQLGGSTTTRTPP